VTGTPERGPWRGHCPLDLWKGVKRGHRCPYITASYVISGTPQSGEMTRILPPDLVKGRQQGRVCLFATESWVILWLIRIDLKQIFIAAIRAPIKFRMVFYNFCNYFWGQHCCCVKTSIIGDDFFLQVSIALNFFTAPLPFRCSGVPVQWHRKTICCFLVISLPFRKLGWKDLVRLFSNIWLTREGCAVHHNNQHGKDQNSKTQTKCNIGLLK